MCTAFSGKQMKRLQRRGKVDGVDGGRCWKLVVELRRVIAAMTGQRARSLGSWEAEEWMKESTEKTWGGLEVMESVVAGRADLLFCSGPYERLPRVTRT
jgi:hypothetical protein